MPTISTLTVDVQSRTSRFTSGIKIATAGLAALAGAAVFAFKQFEDAEKITAQTAAVLESTGHAAHVSAGDVTELANALMAKTGIDDEAIRTGENLLLTFRNIRNEVGQGNNIFDRATVAITNMSVAMGQDFKSSALQLGKALNDPIAGMTALRRVGVQFSAEQTKMIEQFVKHNNLLGAQKVILQEVTKEFGGSAEAQKTASQTMATALSELAETVGSVVAPAFTVLANGLTTVIGFLQDNLPAALQAVSQWFQNLWKQVQPFAETIGSVLLPALQAAWSAIQAHLIPALKRLWDAFGPILKVLGAAAVLFGTVVVGQVLILVTAISHLIDWFSKLVDWVRRNLAEPIVGAIQKIIQWIGQLVGWVKDRLVAAWQAIKGPVLAVINAIIHAVQTLVGWIQDAVHWLSQLGSGVGEKLGGSIGVGPGGNVTVGPGPTMPTRTNGTSAPIVVNFNGTVTDYAQVSAIAISAVRKAMRSGRPV